MPLRKKHVRRIVAAAVFIVVAAPLTVLAVLALGLRGNAYGDAIAAQLAARLHCNAAVHGARPTSPGAAAADSLELSWQTPSGRITFSLSNIVATRGPAAWDLSAQEGRLELKTEDLREALQALNYWLTQPGKDQPPITLAAQAFTVAVDSNLAKVEERGRLRIDRGVVSPYRAKFESMGDASGPAPEKVVLTVHLDPHSPAGAFQIAQAHLDNVPADRFGACLLGTKQPKELAGTVKADVTWACAGWVQPKQNVDPARQVRLAAKGLDLAQWTGALPGGPIQAKDAALELRCTEEAGGRMRSTVSLSAAGGDLGPETLRWLEGLPAGLKTRPPAADTLHVMFDQMEVRYIVLAGRGQFEGILALDGTIPLLSQRAASGYTPILGAAAGGPSDAAALWAAISRALSGAEAAGDGK